MIIDAGLIGAVVAVVLYVAALVVLAAKVEEAGVK